MEDASLHQFVESLTGEDYLRVQDDLGSGFVRLRAAEAQRRQAKQDIRCVEDVVIELMRNARDAGAHALFLATWSEGSVRHLTVIDNGCGIPPYMHEHVFEPFVTSKLDSFHRDRWGVHGRGMALYSIRENATQARIVQSSPGLGSVFSVEIDTNKLPEKRDQSTLPGITKKDGSLVLRGPHNIVRSVIEFAIEERTTTAVYLGSPSHIVATLYALSRGACSLTSIFEDDAEQVAYIERAGFAQDAEELAACAHDLGLPLSARSAHRILTGSIAPLEPCLSLIAPRHSATKQGTRSKKAGKGSASLHVSRADTLAFEERIRQAYRPLARAYYLSCDVPIGLSTNNKHLTISIPLEAAEKPSANDD